jgi:hypothetical protein
MRRDCEIHVSLAPPDQMPIEIKKEIQLEIAHVLFIDIVGYSKLSISDQHAAVEELNRIVRASEQFQRAEAASRLTRIPTGDGMALAFYTSPEAPAQGAVEISRALKEHPRLQLRMGIHSGPVGGVLDVNERANLAGAGLNVAQRVMDHLAGCCRSGCRDKHCRKAAEKQRDQNPCCWFELNVLIFHNLISLSLNKGYPPPRFATPKNVSELNGF